MFVISFFVYGRGDWKQTYASSMMLRHYGMNPFNLEHKEIFEERLRSGEIDWVDAQSTLASYNESSQGQVTMCIFKTRRYLRQIFWPPLKYQAWRKDNSTQGWKDSTKRKKTGKYSNPSACSGMCVNYHQHFFCMFNKTPWKLCAGFYYLKKSSCPSTQKSSYNLSHIISINSLN